MRRAFVSCVLVAAGCGDDGGSGNPPDADTTTPDADTGPPRESAGNLDVIENRGFYDDGGGNLVEYRESRVFGQLYQDRAARFHVETMRSGPCWLRQYTPAQCSTPCTDGLCVATDTCEPWPTRIDGGRLTVTGLAVSLAIDWDGSYYYNTDVLPEDVFADDASVTASFAGATTPAMSIDAGGVSTIDPQIVDGKILIPYPAGQDFVLRWTPDGSDARVRVTYNSNNQGHGAPFNAILECDVPDSDGEVALPAAMLDAFPETRAWTVCAGSDCPPSTIRRYRRGTHAIGSDREVELVVASQLSFGVDHDLP
jgi:hypothetical protein